MQYEITRTHTSIRATARDAKSIGAEYTKTFAHALEAFAHLVGRNETIDGAEFIKRIRATYTHDARIDAICDAITAVMLDYQSAADTRNRIEEELRHVGARLHELGANSGPAGLTPDHVKQSPEFQDAKREHDITFARLRSINAHIVKTFPKEHKDEMRRMREEKANA